MTNPPTGDPFGADALPVELDSHEAAAGADKTIALPWGHLVTIRIPPGVSDNMVLRLPGADKSDPAGPRDLFLRVRVAPPLGAAQPTAGFAPPDATFSPPPTFPPLPTSGAGYPTSGPGHPTSGAGYPTSGAGYSTSGAGYSTSDGGYPVSGAGLPKSGAGLPAAGAPWQLGAPVPPQPAAKKKGLLIGVLAGVVVLLLVFCGGALYLANRGSSTKKTAADTTASPTTSPTPATPPVSPEQYAQLLAAVDTALTPALQQVASGHNPTDLGTAVTSMRSTTMTQVSTLDRTHPPEAVKSAHNNLVSALGAFATLLDATANSVKAGEVCAGSEALSRITTSPAADQVRAAAQAAATVDPAHPYKIGAFLPGANAAQNRRLGNGVYIKKGTRNGSGKLKIDNIGGSDDAAISLVPANTKTTSFTVYVLAGQSYTVTGIKDGTYQIYLTSGADWEPAAPGFSRKCGFSKFADTFDFSTTSGQYTQWTITLTAAAGGNARTDDVNPGDFPTG
jgi:hypothetical protein